VTPRYVLDTNTVVDVLLRRHGVEEQLSEVSPHDVRVSAITLAEL
jgi:predicted nucleic acid-binding protein